MTKLTDDALKALLDGATPGPWRADGEPWNRVVWSSADNRVCFMAHSNGLDDERDIATSNLAAAAPDLARALLDARAENDRLRADAQAANGVWQANLRLQAELAQARADAQAAVALVVKQCADEVRGSNLGLDINDIADDLLALANADGLAAVEALRGEARESAMQALASMGQAQEAYEAQLKAEAELAAAQQREAGLREALEFYGDKKAWTEPPVEVLNGEFGPAYRNQASEVRKDRGSRARAALSNNGRGE